MGDFTLEVVDGLKLDDELRRILRPGELMRDRDGRLRRLPRFFYRIPNWEVMWLTMMARVRGDDAARNWARIPSGPPPTAALKGSSLTTIPRRFAISRKIETAPPCSWSVVRTSSPAFQS